MLLIFHCDVIHPESGEVLIERDEALNMQTPRAQHILDIVNDNAKHYFTYQDDGGNTVVAAPYEAAKQAVKEAIR